MRDVQKFIDEPAERDREICDIFSDSMFQVLMQDLRDMDFEGLEEVEKRWKSEYMHRKAISGFLKDKNIGSKRLASMPDRWPTLHDAFMPSISPILHILTANDATQDNKHDQYLVWRCAFAAHCDQLFRRRTQQPRAVVGPVAQVHVSNPSRGRRWQEAHRPADRCEIAGTYPPQKISSSE